MLECMRLHLLMFFVYCWVFLAVRIESDSMKMKCRQQIGRDSWVMEKTMECA